MTKHRKPPKEAQGASQQAPGAATSLAKAPAKPQVKSRTKREAVEVRPPNAIQKFIMFLKDARRELNRVTWPTPKETFRSTAVLLVLVGISAIYLALVDGILTRILRLIVG